MAFPTPEARRNAAALLSTICLALVATSGSARAQVTIGGLNPNDSVCTGGAGELVSQAACAGAATGTSNGVVTVTSGGTTTTITGGLITTGGGSIRTQGGGVNLGGGNLIRVNNGTFEGDVNVAGTANLNGILNSGQGIANSGLIETGGADVRTQGGDVNTMGGDVRLGGGNISLQGGDIIKANNGTFDGNVATSTLSTTGAATVGGTLAVTGLTTLKGGAVVNNGFTANGGSTLNNGTTMNGGATVNGAFAVNGASTFSGPVSVAAGNTISMGGNRVQDVAAPVLGTDAANKDYVDSRVNGAFRKIDENTQGIAIAMAMGGLSLPADKTFAVGVSAGFYEDKQAVAVQTAIKLTDVLSFNAAVGTGSDNGSSVGGRVGLMAAW